MYNLFDRERLLELYPIIEAQETVILNMVSKDGVNMHPAFSALKAIHPKMYESVRKNCVSASFDAGSLLLYKRSTPWIMTMPIQDSWKKSYNLDYIYKAFQKISSIYKDLGIVSIAIQEGIVPVDEIEKIRSELDLPEIVYYENKEH